MSHQFKLCETCTQRHCNKSPQVDAKQHSGYAMFTYSCTKYRKHQEGFKLREVLHTQEVQKWDKNSSA